MIAMTGGCLRKEPTVKLKLNEQGNVVVQDGKPIYTDDSGKDIAVDYPYTIATISRLNGEAKGHRERAEAAEEKLKSFEGITDPAVALKALETVKNLDDKKLIEAGEVDRIKQESKTAFDEQLKAVEKKYQPIVAERDSVRSELTQEKIGNAFGKSKFIGDKLAVPVDLVQSQFGRFFNIKDGKIQAKGYDGNPLYSKAKPGEIAEFEEAIELLVDGYTHRDSILKGTGASGSGASNAGGNAGGKRSMTRDAFDQLPPDEKMKTVKEVQIVD
jgi:hypothetical protein